ncbi:hypothetical protein J7376_16090 [Paracoccus sp. R12_1]|uniref:hypothetical protein n=1 Tax=unclassified Paracoccus (in: a-proteobacteria) TaxID=2688777 RepID=UPI001ADA07AC|nr:MULTISPECIES: hypothetical protein [unclassified Paracoccus (in: a-proteobacteria)]MBO9456950.1 hypothetical protein [Paracoccus sp. R12_2]MBO9488043.1 hypothetical protein [Paracoccus sp. R12_1]
MREYHREHLGGFAPPLPSSADRMVATSSRAHFCGHVVIGDGSGRGAISGVTPRVVHVESHLELCWCLCLSVRPDIIDLREQARFDWFDEDGEVRSHFFDLLVTRNDGSRLACAIRPAIRSRGRLGRQLPRIATQVRASGFADDVRLLTDHDLDSVELHNAWILHGIRVGDQQVDARAVDVFETLSGTATLSELTSRIGLGVVGFRALLRLLRSGHLQMLRSEKITPSATVYKGSNL